MLLYVDTKKGGTASSVRSTYNASFRRAWKRLRDEASSDAVVVLPPAAATTEVPTTTTSCEEVARVEMNELARWGESE